MNGHLMNSNLKTLAAAVLILAMFVLPAATEVDNAASKGKEDGERTEVARADAKADGAAESDHERARKARVKMSERITVSGSGTGRPGEIPGSVNRLTSTQIDKHNQAFDDIHRALFRLPGINITEEEGFGLRPNIGMRATGTDRSANITLMEDGVLAAPAPYSAPAAYYFPLMGRMEGVEVRKGSSQIKYGPRTNGGALNLQSSSIPEDFGVRVRASVGEHNSQKIYARYGDTWNNLGWLVETYQSNTDGFKQIDTGGDAGFRLQDYVGKLRWSTRPGAAMYSQVELKVGYKDETSNATYLGLTDADFDANPIRRYAASKNDVMDNQHRMASIRHFIMPSEGVDVTTTIYNNGFDRNWYKLDNVGGVRIDQILEDPGTYASEYAWITGDSASANDALAVKANNREYFSQGVESIVGWNVHIAGAENDMEFGLRLHRDEEDRFQWTDGYRMEEGGAMVRTSEGVPGAAGGGDNRVNSARAVAAFWQDNIVMNALILVPGLRFEHIETKREQYASGDPGRTQSPLVTEQTLDVVLPGIGAHYRVTPSVGLIAGIHKGFSPPGPGASAATLPEESVNYEAGVRYGSGTVSASALGFFNDYENLLGKDTFSGGGDGSGDLFNAGEVTAYGVETELRWQPATGRYRFPVSATYTYSYAAFQNSFTSGFHPWGEVEAGDRVPYIPAHQFNMTFAMSNERFDVGLMGNYQSRMRTEAGQGEIPISESTDARFVFDATGELVLGGGLRAFAAVQNIGDQTYIVARRPAGVRPGLPRTISLGLKLDL